jgi:hypothetical protein
MAETVGSIMANHCGKGRYLTPYNFSMELYLGDILIFNNFYIFDVPEFNLGPLHELEPLIKKVYELRRYEYLYKRKACGNLVSHFSMLADPEEGSSTKTYRKRQSEKCHLPIKFFTKL